MRHRSATVLKPAAAAAAVVLAAAAGLQMIAGFDIAAGVAKVGNAVFNPKVTVIAHSSGAKPAGLSEEAGKLFERGGKGPRADTVAGAPPEEAKPKPGAMLASMSPFTVAEASPYLSPRRPYYEVNRAIKGALWRPQAPIAAADATFAEAAQPSRAPLSQAEELALAGSERASAGLFLVSASVASGLQQAEPSFEEAEAAASHDKRPAAMSWSQLLQLARISPEEATIFGALSEKEFRAKELHCMATAIYFESRGEPVRGQQAVAQVIMNRVRSPYYPNTICGVIYQGSQNLNACQFSFACDGIPDRATNKQQWDASMTVARQVIAGKVWVDEVGYATHYHATYVNPKWKSMVKRITRIGVHIFYKAPFADPQLALANAEL